MGVSPRAVPTSRDPILRITNGKDVSRLKLRRGDPGVSWIETWRNHSAGHFVLAGVDLGFSHIRWYLSPDWVGEQAKILA